MKTVRSGVSVQNPGRYTPEGNSLIVPDETILDQLVDGASEVHLTLRRSGDGAGLRVTIYTGTVPVALERVLGLIESLNLTVIDHRSIALRRNDGLLCRLYQVDAEVSPDAPANILGDKRESFILNTIRAVWTGRAAADRLNTLVLSAGLDWREVVLLRAYSRYLQQSTLPYGQLSIETVLLSQPEFAAALISLFHSKLRPDERDVVDRQLHTDQQTQSIRRLLDSVDGLDADRILRAFLNAISATTRTNYYRRGSLSPERPQLALKFRSRDIHELPLPRPDFEIFVYSPDMEGVHLRFGKVARGGLRWSDRLDDYRTEILGLAKAQAVKNAVIVPAGAKGGFVVRNPQATGIDCYRQFISGLLDITDNRISSGEPQHPESVVSLDGTDPYLVVAADKGTSALSDTANGIAIDSGFWLGDAFASGGSVGYDHKKMGITAKGAWVSTTRHLAEVGIDVERDTFTVVGVGDMSGDVFGNAMLASPGIALVAAFDHRHIFIDPNPSDGSAWEERRRLFSLPGSSWSDYDRTLISSGGGVWPRSSKSIPVNQEIRRVLGLRADTATVTPTDMIKAILTAPVDLLFNGGIGTYVKASIETHSHVGDKANDMVRVNALDIQAKAVVEGGNLGLTPLARVEYSQAGGRVNTDAIDNSAGVDCSDREVNIKILLDATQSHSSFDRVARARILASLTGEVADLVLANNRAQNRILGDARFNAAQLIDVHARMVADLTQRRGLDRSLETLPTAEEFASRSGIGRGLTSPELATLLAHAKLDLKADLIKSDVLTDPYFSDRLSAYFPRKVGEIASVDQHPLKLEILATEITNDIFAVGGLTYAYKLQNEAGGDAGDIVRAFVIATEVFGISSLWADIEAASLTPATEYALLIEGRRLLDRASRWLLSKRRQPLSIAEEISRYRGDVLDHSTDVARWLRGAELTAMQSSFHTYTGAAVEPSIARRVSDGLYRYCLLDIVDIAIETGRTVADVAPTYFALSDTLEIDRWLISVSTLSRGRRWPARARLALRDELYGALQLLTHDALAVGNPGDSVDDQIRSWSDRNAAQLCRARKTLDEIEPEVDLASLMVAVQQIRSMATRK